MALCNAGNCIALATHGSVCAVHAKHPSVAQPRRETAEFLKVGIDYDFRPESYPPADEDEEWVTIATIVLNNALSDVISIEACQWEEAIEFQVRDDNEGEYQWKPREANQPFTLRELIAFIDSARGPCGRGLVRGILDYNRREGEMQPGELEGFVEVGSDIYADLARHYRAEVLLWIADSLHER